MKIPTDIGTAPAIPQVSGASAAPGGALVNLGQAIGKAGAVVSRLDDRAQQVLARQQNADNKVWASKAEVELRTRFEEWKKAVGDNFNTDDASEAFNGYADNIMAEAPSNEASNDFTITKNNLWGGHYFPRSVAEEAQIKVRRQEADIVESSRELTRMAVEGKDTGKTIALAESMLMLGNNAISAFPGQFQADMPQKLVDGLWRDVADAHTNSPQDILAFKSDMVGPHGKAIKEMMSPVAYEKLKDHVDGLAEMADKENKAELVRVQQAAQAELAQQQSDNASNLHLAIKEGKITDASTIYAAHKKLGVPGITLQDRNSLLELLSSENEKRRKEGENASAFIGRYNAGIPIGNGEVEQLKGMNKYFTDLFNGWLAAGLSEDVIADKTMQFTNRTTQLPDIVKDGMEAYSRAGSAKDVMPYVKMYRKMVEDPGTAAALTRLEPHAKAMLAMSAAMIDAGAPPADAVRMAHIGAYKLPEQRRVEIQRSPEYMQFGKDAPKMATIFIDKNYDRSIIESQPDTVKGLVADYKVLTNSYAILTDGDMDKARELAERDLKGTWGASYVTGTATMMKNPPEALTGGKEQKWLNEAFRKDLEPLGLKPDEVILGYDRGSLDPKNPSYPLIDRKTMLPIGRKRWAPQAIGNK